MKTEFSKNEKKDLTNISSCERLHLTKKMITLIKKIENLSREYAELELKIAKAEGDLEWRKEQLRQKAAGKPVTVIRKSTPAEMKLYAIPQPESQ